MPPDSTRAIASTAADAGFSAGEGRRRKRRSARLPGSAGRARRFGRRLRESVTGVLVSPTFAMGVLFTFILINSLDFYVLNALRNFNPAEHAPGGYINDDPRRDAGRAVKAQVFYLIYVLGLLLAIGHRRALTSFLKAHPHFVMILALVLASTLWSVNPAEVVRNCIQLSIGLVIALAYAFTHVSSSYRSLAMMVLVPLFLVQGGSVVLFFAAGLDVGPYWFGDMRFGGLAGHPNALGGQVVMGTWAALVVLTDTGMRRAGRIFAAVSLLAFAFMVSVTGSATALLGAIILAISTLVMRFVVSSDPRYRVPMMLALVFVVLVGGGTLYVERGTDEIISEVTGSVGKDTSFTGRDVLWSTAMHAIEEHPVRGWGFDSHESVMDRREYFVPHNHYHNGMLDTWVAGGLLVFALVLYEMVKFATMSVRSINSDPGRAILAPALVMLVILNLTEYSLLRPLSTIYEVYLVAWALLALGAAENAAGRAPVARKRRARTRSGGTGSSRSLTW